MGLDSWCKGRSTAPRKEPEVSQSNTTQAQVAETLTQGTRTSIRQVRTPGPTGGTPRKTRSESFWKGPVWR